MDQYRPRQYSVFGRLVAASIAIAILVPLLVIGLRVALPTESNRDRIVLVIVFASILVLLLAIWTCIVTFRSLRTLQQTIGEVTEAARHGEGDRRVQRLAVREFDSLGQCVNQMLDTLSANVAEADRQRQRTTAIINSASEGIVVVDGHGRVTSINPSAARIFETTMNGACGQPAADLGFLSEEEIREILELPYDRAVQPAVRARAERVLSATIARLHGEGVEPPLGLVWVLRDVTELAQIDEMKSEFISVVSHELRTPLTAIKGFTDLILEGDVGEQQREFLEIVQSNSDRLVSLINDMLDVARIEARQITLNLEVVDVPRAIEQAMSALRPLIEDRQIQMQTEFDEATPTIVADPARFQQILTNLIANACKYTQPGGWVTIRSEPLDGQIAISISDTGIGIEPDALAHVFSKFYRVHHSQARDSVGTGLGLPITKSLVELHGGKIAIASRVGVGTTVRFTLATAGPTDFPRGDTAHAADDVGPVLLVTCEDDHDALRTAIQSIPARVIVSRGTSVAAAAGEAELHRPDVIVVGSRNDSPLLDIRELLDELQGSGQEPTPSIVTIGDTRSEQHARTGVASLPTTVSIADIVTTVRELLPERATRQPRYGRILVAEDDPDSADWIRRLLVREGFEVVLVRDGLAAIVRAFEILPDAIVLDANMPRMGAHEVLPQLKGNPGTREIPVIVISETLPVSGPYFIEAGADDYFAKPFSEDLFVRRLLDVTRKHANG